MIRPHRPHWWTCLVHRVGRRGYFLILLSVVDAFYGYRMLWPESAGQAEQNRYLSEVIDSLGERPSLWCWAVLWWGAGACCLVSAFRKQDYLGFGAAFTMKVIWVAGNVAAGLNGMPGWQLRSVVWAFIGSTVLVIAKWPEPHNSFPEVLAEMQSTGEIPRFRQTDGGAGPEGPGDVDGRGQ
jgi:hypothetical protein